MMSPLCKHSYAPASTQLPSSLDIAEFEEHFSRIQSVISRFPVHSKEIRVNEHKK